MTVAVELLVHAKSRGEGSLVLSGVPMASDGGGTGEQSEPPTLRGDGNTVVIILVCFAL